MRKTISRALPHLVSLLLAVVAACSDIFPATAYADTPQTIRIGFFPNVTHAQALYAKQTGSYEQALGSSITWTTVNAGPSAVEALFSDELDAAYIGPNPTINGYTKSRGEKFVVVSGAALGGAALVVRPEAKITGPTELGGKTIATPQLGNTQDVAARKWLKEHGYTLSEKGGNVTVVPVANSDQLSLFKKGELDASWTVEPWVSRLEQEGGAKVLFFESSLWKDGKYVTTNLVFSKKFINERPEAAAKLVAAHVDITQKINADKKAATQIINRQLKTELGSALPESEISSAIERVSFSWDPASESLFDAAQSAVEVGFARSKPDLIGLYNLDLLNQALKARALPEITVQPQPESPAK